MGRLFDAYGPRPIMIVGTLMLVLGTMMTSISTEYYQYILAQGILVGLGIGTVYVFRARAGRMISISSCICISLGFTRVWLQSRRTLTNTRAQRSASRSQGLVSVCRVLSCVPFCTASDVVVPS